MPAVRQEAWAPMSSLALAEHRCGSRHASRSRYFLERRVSRRRKDNHAVLAPRATTKVRSIAQRDRRSARHIDFLDLAGCEEAEEPAVRRPEWRHGLVSPRQLARDERIERADPQTSPAIRIPAEHG